MLHRGAIARTAKGFTLIELVVTLIVLAILAGAALPSFVQSRQRAIARGAAQSIEASFMQARLEAAKRNDFVTLSIRGADRAWCIGLEQGSTGCDCLARQCGVQTVPTADLRGARLLAAADFNGTSDLVIDPRLGVLSDPSKIGSVTIRSSSDQWEYRVQVNVSLTAQTNLCTPSGAKGIYEAPAC